ncbi:hypothetical protein I0C86_38050, partial [Plantactinospora sp. S1510]
MTRSATPGSPYPAGRPTDGNGNGTQSSDYLPSDPAEETEYDAALLSNTGHGGVAVFQAPQPPARNRPTRPAAGAAARPPTPVEHPD